MSSNELDRDLTPAENAALRVLLDAMQTSCERRLPPTLELQGLSIIVAVRDEASLLLHSVAPFGSARDDDAGELH